MCGIVGVFSFNDNYSISEDELIAMRDTMVPRGPDDAGVFAYHHDGLQLAFGHRRLSILDVSPE